MSTLSTVKWLVDIILILFITPSLIILMYGLQNKLGKRYASEALHERHTVIEINIGLIPVL